MKGKGRGRGSRWERLGSGREQGGVGEKEGRKRRRRRRRKRKTEKGEKGERSDSRNREEGVKESNKDHDSEKL